MRTIDRHIVTEWLKTFVLALGLTFGLLLLEDVYDNLEDFVRFGASASEVLTYYAVLSPSLLPTVVPASLLISLLFSLGALHRDNEIIALRAVGLSLWQITRGLWLMGAILAAGLFVLNARVVPWSVEQSRLLYDNRQYSAELERREASEVGVSASLTFRNSAAGRLWFINRFSEFTETGYGITVHELDPEGNEVRRLAASEGFYDDVTGHWVLLEGRDWRFDPEDYGVIFSRPFERMEAPDLTEAPELMQFLQEKPTDLSFFELERVLAVISPEEDPRVRPHAVRFWSVLVQPFSALVVMGLGIPFAVAGVRTNPAVNASKAFGLFIGYFLVVNLAEIVGTRGWLSPPVAASLPTGLMIVLAGYLFHRVRSGKNI